MVTLKFVLVLKKLQIFQRAGQVENGMQFHEKI